MFWLLCGGMVILVTYVTKNNRLCKMDFKEDFKERVYKSRVNFKTEPKQKIQSHRGI